MKKQDFLVEIGTEELPPKALKQLGVAFHDALVKGIENAALAFSTSRWFAAPRRLAVVIEALDVAQADQSIQQRGPATRAAFDDQGMPTKAALGFAKGCGVSVDELEQLKTDKGVWLAYTRVEKGKKATALLPGLVQTALQQLPIPKRMKWGASKAEFVRPVHWLLMLLGEDLIECELLGVTSGSVTYGHRFHSEGEIKVEKPSDYKSLLRDKGYVIADYEQRQQLILDKVKALVSEHDELDASAKAHIDADLLDEVTGLVEWPVPLLGHFEDHFLEVPKECLVSAMQGHQKYFPVLSKDNELLPFFITVANLESQSPNLVIEGNERVIRPRLSDAKFFLETDRKKTLGQHHDMNRTVVFQSALGTVFEKSERVASLAERLADQTGVDKALVSQAALLAKADLGTEMVGEFPELQGIMGRYYATYEGLDVQVANAIEEHYQPKFAKDELPASDIGAYVAIADRIDTLMGILGIGKFPSGDKDPFALRRATLGILRIMIEKQYAFDLKALFQAAKAAYGDRLSNDTVVEDALSFVQDRYRAWFQDQGIDSDVIIAVQALEVSSPFDVHQRVHAVNAFKQLEEAASLAEANKRVANILAKSDTPLESLQIDAQYLVEPAEKALVAALESMQSEVDGFVASKEYTPLLKTLAGLRSVIDDFFTDVFVNAEDPNLKQNRLAILKTLRALFYNVADISKLAIKK